MLTTFSSKKYHGYDAIHAKFLEISTGVIAKPLSYILTNASTKGSVLFLNKTIVIPVYEKHIDLTSRLIAQ